MRKIVTLGLLVMGCGADGSDSASGTLGVERSLPSACSAKYSCEISGDTFETPLHEYGPYFSATLQEEDGVCVFEGKIEIQPGGQAFVPGEWPRKGEWSGSAEAFVLCVNGACATCERVGESAPSPGGRCTGSADSCSGRGAGSCSTQKGCHFTSHVKYDGSFSYQCTGYAKDCEDFDSMSSCEAQDGCGWK